MVMRHVAILTIGLTIAAGAPASGADATNQGWGKWEVNPGRLHPSAKGGGNNELSLDDTAGKERARKETEAGGDQTPHIWDGNTRQTRQVTVVQDLGAPPGGQFVQPGGQGGAGGKPAGALGSLQAIGSMNQLFVGRTPRGPVNVVLGDGSVRQGGDKGPRRAAGSEAGAGWQPRGHDRRRRCQSDAERHPYHFQRPARARAGCRQSNAELVPDHFRRAGRRRQAGRSAGEYNGTLNRSVLWGRRSRGQHAQGHRRSLMIRMPVGLPKRLSC
jgi:hypothetical protein